MSAGAETDEVAEGTTTLSGAPPPRVIDLWSGVGLVVASMVGVGVLVSNGYMASALSPGQTFAVWGAQAAMAIAGAIAYARISQIIPRSGGEYRYLSELLHPFLGYLAGWTSLLIGFAAPVATAAATAGSFGEEIGVPLPAKATAGGIIAAVTCFQMFDMQAAKWSQNLLVAIKASLFVSLVAVGVLLGTDPSEAVGATVEAAPMEVFALNLFFAAYAFSGWNASIYASEEFIHPRRDVARSMIIGVLGVTVVYIALTYVFVFNLTPADIASMGDNMERGAHVIVAKLAGDEAAVLASVGIILVLCSSCNAMTFVGPRVNAAMAGDGYLPGVFLARPGKPPTMAILAQGTLAMVLMLSHSLAGLIENVGFMLVVMSALTVLGLVRVRLFPRPGEDERPGAGSVIAALLYFGAASWMSYFGIKRALSAEGTVIYWIAAVTGVTFVAYLVTRVVRRNT